MALVDSRGYQLVTDAGEALSGGLQIGNQVREMRYRKEDRALAAGDRAKKDAFEKSAAEKSAVTGDLFNKIVSGLDRSDPVVSQLAALDPAKFEQAFKTMGMINDSKKQEAAEFAYNLQNTKPEMRTAKIQARAQELSATGRDPTHTLSLLQESPEDQDAALKFIQLGALPLEKREELKQKDAEIAIKGQETVQKGMKIAGDAEKRAWDIKKIQSDIDVSKQNAYIAAATASLAKESNALKREELQMKIDSMKTEKETAVREKTAELESARTNMDNMINTVDRLLKNKSLNDVVGSIEGRLPSVFSDEGADAIKLLETLGSQAFLSQIPNIKGMGQLSNTEGEKLQSALQNTSRVQSEKQIRANLLEMQRIILKGRGNLAKRYGMKESIPDTPAAAPSASEIDAIMKKYGG